MSLRSFAAVVAAGLCLASPGRAQVAPTPSETLRAQEPQAIRIYTNTDDVEDLASDGKSVWVATRGGLAQYDASNHTRVRLFTTAHGLDTPWVRSVRILANGIVEARTRTQRCALRDQSFHCVPAPMSPPRVTVGQYHRGLRVTATRAVAGETWRGTAGGGLWVGDTSVTPTGELCGNHVTSLERHEGDLWVGTFNDGLCVRLGERFEARPAPFRMVNALASTPKGLYVAAGEGLFRTTDGVHFDRVVEVSERGANGLAFDGKSLFVTTPGALHRLRIQGGPSRGAWWLPGGSRSLQSVSIAGSNLWMATEDRGVIRFDLRHGRRAQFDVFDRTRGLESSWMLDAAGTCDGGVIAATLQSGFVHIDAHGRAARLDGMPDPWGLTVHASRSGTWVGSQGGAALISNGTVRRVEGLPDGRVHAILEEADGVYFGTELGLAYLPVQTPAETNASEKCVFK